MAPHEVDDVCLHSIVAVSMMMVMWQADCQFWIPDRSQMLETRTHKNIITICFYVKESASGHGKV